VSRLTLGMAYLLALGKPGKGGKELYMWVGENDLQKSV
jgi:hypothetical protein